MSSEQIPPEFEWIKPGVKATCQKTQRNVTIKKPPHKAHECYEIKDWFVLWECYGTFGGSKCADLIPGHQGPITLTLTREQAEALRSGLTHIQWWNLSEKTKEQIVQIEKQIEEKLK